MSAELRAPGQVWDGQPLWDDEYPVEADLSAPALDEFRAALDRARAADLREREEAFDEEYEDIDAGIRDDLADVDITSIPPSAAEEMAQFQYDRETWERDRRRRRRGAATSPLVDDVPYGPQPYTPPERETGDVTADMAQFKILADTAFGDRYPGVSTGQWIYDTFGGDQVIVGYDVPIPDGAVVIGDDAEARGYVVSESQMTYHVPWSDPLPFGADRVREDEDGTWVRFPNARLMYRFDDVGELMSREDHDVREPATIALISQSEALNAPRTTIVFIDVDTRRIFETSASGPTSETLKRIEARNDGGWHVDGDLSNPDPELVAALPRSVEESLTQAMSRIEGRPLSPWHDDPDSPLSPTNRAKRRQAATFFDQRSDPAETPPGTADAGDPPPRFSPVLIRVFGVVVGLVIIIGGIVVAVTSFGGDDDRDGDGALPADEDISTSEEEPPLDNGGEATDPAPAESDAAGATQDPPQEEGDGDTNPPASSGSDEDVRLDPRDLGIPLSFVPLPGGTWLVVFDDPAGGSSWSILNAEGEMLDASQLRAVWLINGLLTQPWLDAAVNFSSFPCGAVTDEFRVTCPLGAGPLEEGEYFIIGAQLEGQVADGDAAFTYGLAFDDDDDEDDNYQFAPPFDADFFRNTEHWYRLHIAADGTRSMWADGARDGVLGLPRASSAAVIEWDDTIIWLIPRAEVPGDSPAYRVTAFHNRGVPGAVPVPDNSGGDVSGLTVTEPLIAIDGEFVEFSDLSTLPPDIPDPLPRLPIELPPDEHITAALVDDFMTRAEAATASGDPEQVFGLVLPELLAGETGDTCRADMEASIVLADGLTLVETPSGPDTSQGFPFYVVETTIDYSTGSVPYPAVLAASNVDGRLYLLLPSCLG